MASNFPAVGTMSSRERQIRERNASAAPAGGASPVSRPAERENQTALANARNLPKPGSLVRNPIPRRGAPVTKAFSVTNVSVRRDSDNSDSEDNGPQEEQESVLRHPRTSSSSQAGGSRRGNDDETKQKLMATFLPDLKDATDDLAASFAESDTESSVFSIILQARREDVVKNRNRFLASESTTSFLIDWEGSHALSRFVQTHPQAGDDLARINIVATRDHVLRIQSEEVVSRLDFLETLDAGFPRLFHAPGTQGGNPGILLEIRTRYAIELLGREPDKEANPREIIARVFCEHVDNADIDELLERGPYRRLSGREKHHEDAERCQERVMDLLRSLQEGGNFQPGDLEKRFPFPQLLEELDIWLTETLTSQDPTPEPGQASPTYSRMSSDEAESQEIARVGHSRPEPSMFQGRESIRQLEATRNRSAEATGRATSGPGAATASREPPRDWPQISSKDLLRDLPVSSSAPAGSQGLKRRPQVTQERDDDADDSDDFEEDRRSPKIIKIGQPQAWQAPRRSLQAPREPPSRIEKAPVAHVPASSMPSRPPMSSATAVAAPSSSGQFEHPRDQQAYRDKARNIKVDKLLRDEPLPPHFDRVVLGPKEKRKVMGCGKNPYRTEAEVDDDGRPFNTEYDPAVHGPVP
ncbi:hypothetical protein HIM_09985 [Hirsutella minnesotensis 3608]|uniref:Uncharacterized protein n=1 Tax=Hirsutella minnesotensis 3608 TaxID=1043627 RepID=A0A0F7ZKK7_9HYPO|nr:hypothetical protein HIM_09985 [Hirsutella minnesotensis 3608]